MKKNILNLILIITFSILYFFPTRILIDGSFFYDGKGIYYYFRTAILIPSLLIIIFNKKFEKKNILIYMYISLIIIARFLIYGQFDLGLIVLLNPLFVMIFYIQIIHY